MVILKKTSWETDFLFLSFFLQKPPKCDQNNLKRSSNHTHHIMSQVSPWDRRTDISLRFVAEVLLCFPRTAPTPDTSLQAPQMQWNLAGSLTRWETQSSVTSPTVYFLFLSRSFWPRRRFIHVDSLRWEFNEGSVNHHVYHVDKCIQPSRICEMFADINVYYLMYDRLVYMQCGNHSVM